jgi:hypothetical protein
MTVANMHPSSALAHLLAISTSLTTEVISSLMESFSLILRSVTTEEKAEMIFSLEIFGDLLRTWLKHGMNTRRVSPGRWRTALRSFFETRRS